MAARARSGLAAATAGVRSARRPRTLGRLAGAFVVTSSIWYQEDASLLFQDQHFAPFVDAVTDRVAWYAAGILASVFGLMQYDAPPPFESRWSHRRPLQPLPARITSPALMPRLLSPESHSLVAPRLPLAFTIVRVM